MIQDSFELSRLGRPRLRLLLVVVFLWVAAIGARLFYLQVEKGEVYSDRAVRQQQSLVQIDSPRGTIFDARGRALAISVAAKSLYAELPEVRDLDAVVKLLTRELGGPESRWRKKLGAERRHVPLERKLDREVAERILAHGLEGLYLLDEARRDYPHGSLAAHVLGFVGMDESLAGLEFGYEDVIAGTKVTRRVLRDARSGVVVVPDSLEENPEPGKDLYLTLDASVQYLAEKGLADAVERARAKTGSIVILDAHDSSVVAMASYPPFDPAHFGSVPPDVRRNRAIQDAYEPGSTFKVVTAAAGLHTLRVHPDDEFDCQHGSIVVDSMLIRDHKSFGTLSFRDVMAKSSNVGIIKAAQEVGDEAFHEMVLALGFGRETGIDLPGESPGLLTPLEGWSVRHTAYGSFGQSVAATALQIANAFAAVANGGRLNKPYIVRAVGEGGEVTALPAREPLGRPLTAETAQRVARLLEGVVAGGTGRAASIAGFRVAGKTGTAQKAIDGSYHESARIASFAGFVPARNPRLVAVVTIDEPQGLTNGGDVAAPVFSRILGDALVYLAEAPVVRAKAEPERWLRDPQLQIAAQGTSQAAALTESSM